MHRIQKTLRSAIRFMPFFTPLFLVICHIMLAVSSFTESATATSNIGNNFQINNPPFLSIKDGWISTNQAHQILRLSTDGQLIALYNPDTSSKIAGSKLLSTSENGENVVRLVWNENGDEFLEVIDMISRTSSFLSLEGRFLRALRMNNSGSKIATLLSDGFLYELSKTDKQLMLTQLGSLPSVLAAEWLIDDNGNLHWVSPDGKGYNKLDGQITEQFYLDNHSQLASAFPLNGKIPTWLLQDQGQFLYLIKQNFDAVALGNVGRPIKSMVNFDWFLSANAVGSYFVFHPLLPKRSRQELFFQEILGVATHGIIGLNQQGEISYLPIAQFYKNLAANLAIHKRIAVEEITNLLATANSNRELMSSEAYSSQKNAFRKVVNHYLDQNLTHWQKGVAGEMFDLSSNALNSLNEPFTVSKIEWENNRLSQAISAKDELIIKLHLTSKLPDALGNSIKLWTSTNESLPVKITHPDSDLLKLELIVPKLAENLTAWLLNVQIGSEYFPLSIPIQRQQKQALAQISAISSVNDGFITHLQWNGQLLRAEEVNLELAIWENNTNKSQPVITVPITTDFNGFFSTKVELPSSQSIAINRPYKLTITEEEETLISEVLLVETRYPFAVKIGAKEGKNKMVFEHPLLQQLPNEVYQAEDTFVLLVGNSAYKYAPDADFAIRDVRLMHTYFTEVLGVPRNQITVLENASLSDLVYYLGSENQQGRLKDMADRDNKRLMVYFSGHGMPSLDGKDGYLLPVDARLNRPDITALKLSSFYEQLRVLEMGETVVFLESCFSGRTGNGQSLLPNASASVGVQIKIPLLANEKVAIFTASDAAELASWDRINQTGLFTARLLEGFRHFANQKISFSPEDLSLWLEDPIDGVYARARKWYSREQHPQLFANDSDLPLFKIKAN